MKLFDDWRPASGAQLLNALPEVLSLIESHLDEYDADARAEIQQTITLLRTDPLQFDDLRSGKRQAELSDLAAALTRMAERQGEKGDPDQGLLFLNAAHELARGGSSVSRPSAHMRKIVFVALHLILTRDMEHIRGGDADAEQTREAMRGLINSAWGGIPEQLSMAVDEMLLNGLDRVRKEVENDRDLFETLIGKNVQTVMGLDVPTRMMDVIDEWEEIGLHVAPNRTKAGARANPRPKNLSDLVPRSILDRISAAVETGNVESIKTSVSEVENQLEANLQRRIASKPHPIRPLSVIKFRGGPDRFFEEALMALNQNNDRALNLFRNIHVAKPDNTFATEWYAYALICFGNPRDIHEIIELLEDAVTSEHFRLDLGWTARWNLACALRRLPARADQALDQLLPALETSYHGSEVFELCLLWALEQNRDDVLESLLLRSPWHEAHLLAALYRAQTVDGAGETPEFREHFLRIAKILDDPDYVFPSPAEQLSEADIAKLTTRFIDLRLSDAGIEWFRQRLATKEEQYWFKNWECAATLYDAAEDRQEEAWHCRIKMWGCAQRNPKLNRANKTRVLRRVIQWGGDNGFSEGAIKLLRHGWKDTTMNESDVRLIEERLGGASGGGQKSFELPNNGTAHSKQVTTQSLTNERANEIIRQHIASLQKIQTFEDLADRAADARDFLGAVHQLNRDVSPDGIREIGRTIEIAVELKSNLNESRAQELIEQLKAILPILVRETPSFPYELKVLAKSCEYVIRKSVVAERAIVDVVISSPKQLNPAISPAIGKAYRTHIMVRLRNPGAVSIEDIEVTFLSPSLSFGKDPIQAQTLGPERSCVVDCEVEITPEFEGESVDVTVHVACRVGGIPRSVKTRGSIPIRSVGDSIPVHLRYMSSVPVSVDRLDLFHGRDHELQDLTAAFAEGRLRKLYFVNGIRRVGKSTLMAHLGRHCGPDVLAILLNLETSLQGAQGKTSDWLVRQLIDQVLEMPELAGFSLERPPHEAFENDPPWKVFDAFLRSLKTETQRKNILICFDESQTLVKSIADPNNSIDDSFLTWLRDKIQSSSSTFVICTGSETYKTMRKRYDHTLWGNMEPYNVSFVDRGAMEMIAAEPVRKDGVTWLPEALDRLWDLTEGHPWIIQKLSETAVKRLSDERRRLVGPMDIDWAVERVAEDPGTTELWWQEKENIVTATHRQIAFLVLQQQAKPRQGVPESTLASLCQKGGIRDYGTCLDEMQGLELFTEDKSSGEPVWRIRGGFLERYLINLRDRELRSQGARLIADPVQPSALMLDWENVVISLHKLLDTMPKAKADAMRERIGPEVLARNLAEAAARHGSIRQKWAVACWDRPSFTGHQAALKRTRFFTDMAGSTKADASDHVLRERIHDVLRDHPDINAYIIGTGDADFAEVIRTLQQKGKYIVLWATREATSDAYRHFLHGSDRIHIEWLEDLVFADTHQGVANVVKRVDVLSNVMRSSTASFHSDIRLNDAISFALAPNGGKRWDHDALEENGEQNKQLCNWLGISPCDGESAKALLCPNGDKGWETAPVENGYSIRGLVLMKACEKLGIPFFCEEDNYFRFPVQPGFPFLLALADLYCQMDKCTKTHAPVEIALSRDKGLHTLRLPIQPKGKQNQPTDMGRFKEFYMAAVSGTLAGGHETSRRLCCLRLAKIALEHEADKDHQSLFDGVKPDDAKVDVMFIPSPRMPAVEIRWITREP